MRGLASWSAVLFAVGTLALWLADPPRRPGRHRLACAAALASAAVGLLVNQALSRLWFRERPFVAHPGRVLLLAHRSPDASFPSDHATAAFAIAGAVLLVAGRLGVVFLLAAVAVGLSRIAAGLHYPGDVAAGAGIGLAAAAVVTLAARRPLVALVAVVSRATDPLLGAIRHVARGRRPARG